MTTPQAPKYRSIPTRLARYEETVVERFCLMTIDGGHTDASAAYDLWRAGQITRKDMEIIGNARP